MNHIQLPPLARRLTTVAFVAAAAACGGAIDSKPADAPTAVEVRVVVARMRPLARSFEAGGVIKARATAQITPRIAAELREIRVRPGDRVRQGQIVAVLDDRDLRARHEQAQALLSASQSAAVSAEAERESAAARLALARTNHERITQLRARNSATPQELDRATADLQMAEAAVRSAAARTVEGAASVRAAQSASLASEVAASFSSIIAPFDGLVTSRLLEPGNMAAPGVPLLTLETTDGFRLEAQVDEARARFFDIGDSAEILLDGTGEPDAMAGRVIEIGRAIDPAAHAFVVKVQIPAGAAVRSGMFARLRFTGAARDALVVPASAVVRRSQLSLVFVVDAASRARMRAITAGTQSGEAVEVLAGVQAGETIIAGPPAWLADGTVVRVTGQRP